MERSVYIRDSIPFAHLDDLIKLLPGDDLALIASYQVPGNCRNSYNPFKT
jgi:hypothetical protein